MKFRNLLIPAATAASLMLPLSALAQQSTEFNVLMNEGVGYYKSGDYIKAIESFQKAQKIDNIPDITYNIAKSYQLLGDCDLALKYFREYALTSPENAQSVQSYIETLNDQCGTKTGSLVMKCTPDDAMVTIDYDDPVQCNATYELKTGEHQLKFTAKNFVQETRTVDIKENQPRNVVIEMKPTPGAQNTQTNTSQNEQMPQNAQAVQPYTPPAKEKASNLFWAGIGTAGGGLVFSVAGIAMLATSHREISINGRYDGYFERSTPKLVGGAVMSAIGITALTAGTIILVIDKFFKDQPQTDNTQSFRITPSIAVTPDAAAASVTMTF